MKLFIPSLTAPLHPPPHPNAPTHGQQGEAHAGPPTTGAGIAQGTAAGHAGSSCPASQAGWEGKSRGKILWQAGKAQPQHTHTQTQEPTFRAETRLHAKSSAIFLPLPGLQL